MEVKCSFRMSSGYITLKLSIPGAAGQYHMARPGFSVFIFKIILNNMYILYSDVDPDPDSFGFVDP